MRIRLRLPLLLMAVVAVSALATAFLVGRSTESMFRSLVFSGDTEKARTYAPLLAGFHERQGGWRGVQEFLARFPDRVVVADASGEIVGDTALVAMRTVHPQRHLEKGAPVMAGAGGTGGGELIGTVLVGTMVDSSLSGADERFLASILSGVAWSAAAAALIALALGIFFAARLTSPLRKLADAAGLIASGQRALPVPETGNDELSILAKAFNRMGAELARLDDAKRRVIADSAHELRTPLTLVQGMVEGMIDGVLPADRKTLESVHEETLRLSRLIDTLRELELIDSGELALGIEDVDLLESLRKAVALFAPAAAEKSISLSFAEPPSPIPPARMDPLRIGEVVYNILANAMNYTPRGGRVRVSAYASGDASIGFSVEDSGPGIAPDQRPRVFERFYRIDPSRSTGSGGRGLGLAIASEIVKAHGGSIEVGESGLGGARFTVTLPRSAV